MTEPRRRFDIEPKTGIPTVQQWAAHKRQAALYAQGLMESYRDCHPMPMGNRVTGQEYQSYTEMIRPETLAKMTRPLPRATAYPDYGWM